MIIVFDLFIDCLGEIETHFLHLLLEGELDVRITMNRDKIDILLNRNYLAMHT